VGHNPKLIEQICAKLRRVYPEEAGFKYLIEQPLYKSDRRMLPDIQVLKEEKLNA
jgi:hypothetical protein